jgi:hypothetical protein
VRPPWSSTPTEPGLEWVLPKNVGKREGILRNCMFGVLMRRFLPTKSRKYSRSGTSFAPKQRGNLRATQEERLSLIPGWAGFAAPKPESWG